MGRAGIVLGLEVSRLARNSTDWHRLLEICALTDTLILDEDGIYEAELHLLRARLRGGALNKARRGELRTCLRVGFVYDMAGKVILDSDGQVQNTLNEVLQAVVAELSRSLKWRAKACLGLGSVSQTLTGAVAAVQRVDSVLRLNVHFHILCLDGVYVRSSARDGASDDGGPLSFHALPTPTRSETTDVARRIADRVELILKKHGRESFGRSAGPSGTLSSVEATVSSARAGLPALRRVQSSSRRHAG